MSKISVALCTYNGADFLSEQLASILAQTRQPDELVVNDDCSTDRTTEIIKEFAGRAPFPVVLEINSKNLGSTKNFERAVERAGGDVIFLCDQDDVWLPEKIEKIIGEFDSNERLGMVFTNAELVDERLVPIGKNLWDFTFRVEDRQDAARGKTFEVLMRRNIVTGATMAFRSRFREVFAPIPIDVPNTIHDGWIALVIAARARVKFIEENLIKYRQHTGQQMGVDWRYGRESTANLRFEYYRRSVDFYRSELDRVLMMSDVLRHYPQFQIDEIQNSIDEIVSRNLEEKQELVRHLEARMNLPATKYKRIVPIWREFKTRRYGRFSRGVFSPLKDLLESWEKPE